MCVFVCLFVTQEAISVKSLTRSKSMRDKVKRFPSLSSERFCDVHHLNSLVGPCI